MKKSMATNKQKYAVNATETKERLVFSDTMPGDCNKGNSFEENNPGIILDFGPDDIKLKDVFLPRRLLEKLYTTISFPLMHFKSNPRGKTNLLIMGVPGTGTVELFLF